MIFDRVDGRQETGDRRWEMSKKKKTMLTPSKTKLCISKALA